MAASTTLVTVTPNAANPKAWTKLADGAKNLVLKVLRNCPQLQVYYGATASQPGDASDYFPLDWDDVSLSVSLTSSDSLWYRVTTGHQTTFAVISQDA